MRRSLSDPRFSRFDTILGVKNGHMTTAYTSLA